MKLRGIRVECAAGWILLLGTDSELVRFCFAGDVPPPYEPGETPALAEAARQMREYFAGARRTFDLPLRLVGTEFQRAVWLALADIPYGETRTYADIARAVGHPKALRAVGSAIGANPFGIVLPCHRVLPASGALGGFRAGAAWKRWLLELEGTITAVSHR